MTFTYDKIILNLRCCCTPEKVMGIIVLPHSEDIQECLQKGKEFQIHLRQMVVTSPFDYASDRDICAKLKTDVLQVKPITRSETEREFAVRKTEMAVYSEDRDTSEWRKLPEFFPDYNLPYLIKTEYQPYNPMVEELPNRFSHIFY